MNASRGPSDVNPTEQRPEAPQLPSLVLPGGRVDPDAVRAASDVEESGEDDGLRRVAFRLSRDLRKRLDKYLTDRISFMSRTQLQRLIEEGGVTVNGRAAKASTALRLNDLVEVVVPPPPPKEIQPERIPLQVLFEDEHLIVLNKQPDIIVHPARSHLSGTMVNALAWHIRNESTTGGALSSVGSEFARPGVVHRLDRNTTGVIVFAKNDEAHWKLGRQFELRTVDKRYLAVVHGRVEPVADVIDLPIGPHPSSVKGQREKYVVRHDELGRPSVTIYRVRERFAKFTIVELELKTGRTHQIRVHLRHLGWPIVGDDMYGGGFPTAADITGGRASADEPVIHRQALHAAMLGFTHPVTGARVSFSAPVPEDLASLVQTLRASPGPHDRLTPAGATLDLSAVVPDRA